jgi:hypothetical protein
MSERDTTTSYEPPPEKLSQPDNMLPLRGQVPMAAAKKIRWYHEILVVTVTLVVFFPLGLWLLWTNPTIAKRNKLAVTAFVVVLLCLILMPLYNDLAPMFRTPSLSTYAGASPSAPKGNAAFVKVPSDWQSPAFHFRPKLETKLAWVWISQVAGIGSLGSDR